MAPVGGGAVAHRTGLGLETQFVNPGHQQEARHKVKRPLHYHFLLGLHQVTAHVCTL